MIASVRGGGIDIGEEDDESEGTAAVIADLVAQGADLNASTERGGETSLHLAARFARADAAKRLLDAGADVNFQDGTGRTPLHSAVAADAMGVFQILLRNRATNLNARTTDGTTPLILATRLAVEGMVEDLINADADINAADNSGKTALHWAAAVNNTEAINVLLMHGANRDAQVGWVFWFWSLENDLFVFFGVFFINQVFNCLYILVNLEESYMRTIRAK